MAQAPSLPMCVSSGPPTSTLPPRINKSTWPSAALVGPQPFRQRQLQVCHSGVPWPCIQALCLLRILWYGVYITPSRGSGGSRWATLHVSLSPCLQLACSSPRNTALRQLRGGGHRTECAPHWNQPTHPTLQWITCGLS